MPQVYLIRASTGCTCCQYENFRQGPYTDQAEPRAIIEKWAKGEGNPLASKFSKFGNYRLEEHEAEEISGNRFVIGDTVWGPGIEQKPD